MANRRVPYLYTKRGVFYLQKRVPADLQHRYGRPFIRKSLRTKDPKQANRLASSLVDGLEREWLDLRFGISEETPASDLLLLQREQEILLSVACADYCRMKGRACLSPVKLCHNFIGMEDRNYGSEALFR